VEATAGWVLIGIGAVFVLLNVLWFPNRVSGRTLDVLAVANGVIVAVGGLMVTGADGLGNWVAAIVFICVAAVAKRHALFAPGGPFRT
jgi:hypothetical protein